MLDYTRAGNYKPPKISSKVPSQEYKDNFDRIFAKENTTPIFCRHCRELEKKCSCGNYEPDNNNK